MLWHLQLIRAIHFHFVPKKSSPLIFLCVLKTTSHTVAPYDLNAFQTDRNASNNAFFMRFVEYWDVRVRMQIENKISLIVFNESDERTTVVNC
jgi:hypothetical protein